METSYRQIKKRLGIDEALADSSEDETDQYICKFERQKNLTFFSEPKSKIAGSQAASAA